MFPFLGTNTKRYLIQLNLVLIPSVLIHARDLIMKIMQEHLGLLLFVVLFFPLSVSKGVLFKDRFPFRVISDYLE